MDGTAIQFSLARLIPALLVYLIIGCTGQIDGQKISEKMCKEYSKAVFQLESNPISMPGRPAHNNVSHCAIEAVRLIVGGTLAHLKEFPHMAVIGFGNSPTADLTWECGAALISETYLLTAAHCLSSVTAGPSQQIKIGATFLAPPQQKFLVETEDTQTRDIVDRIAHPAFSKKLHVNDIGLLKLKDSILFTGYVRPACLFTEDTVIGKTAMATGFGKTSYSESLSLLVYNTSVQEGKREPQKVQTLGKMFAASLDSSDYLLKVTLKIYPENVCKKALKLDILDSMICAGELEGGKDTCHGDSGGPLQIVLPEPYCMYGLIGVTSFGKYCAFKGTAAIYTRVSKFIPWIEGIVWKK